MVLENFDPLLNKLAETEGKGLPFSLLGIQQQEQPGAPPSIFNTPPETGQGASQAGPTVFDSADAQPGQVGPKVFDSVDAQPEQDTGKNISKGIAKSIESGINAIFDIDSKSRQPQAAAAPPLKAPPLQGGSTQLPQEQAKSSGVSRIQQILDQQLELRNKIRSRR